MLCQVAHCGVSCGVPVSLGLIHPREQDMLVLPDEVPLFDVARASECTGRLIRLHREDAAQLIDGDWRDTALSSEAVTEEADYHWPWCTLVSKVQSKPIWTSLAIKCPSGAIQGAARLVAGRPSHLDPGHRAVEIDRIAAAPWNRPWLVGSPQFRGAGSALVDAAIRESYSTGLGGRVVLLAIPGEENERFYAGCGFQVVEVAADDSILYELPASAALANLAAQGYLK